MNTLLKLAMTFLFATGCGRGTTCTSGAGCFVGLYCTSSGFCQDNSENAPKVIYIYKDCR